MCTATPSSGTQMCRPTNVPPFESGSDRAVDVERLVRELAAAAARVGEEGPDAAVDVDPGVGLRRAGRVGERVELVLPLRQVLAPSP